MAAFFGRLQASSRPVMGAAIAGSMFLSGSGFSHSQCRDSRAWWDRTTTTNLPFAPNWWDNTVDRSQPTKPCQVMFVLGGPGAGKGTACNRLLEEDKTWAAISAGDCLREERNRKGSEHGDLINNFIAEGKIVPVEITIALILNKMKACDGISKFLIDGFPRSEDNYDGWFAQAGETTTCLGCIFMECPLEVLTQRIVGRAAAAEAAGQEVRKDDNLESLQKRFATFKEQSLPIVTRFTEKNQNYAIKADGSKEEVYALFKAALANGDK